MASRASTGKTIFKVACATGGAVLASGVGLPWLGAMAGSCLPKALEGSLDFLVSAVAADKKQEVLASLIQKPLDQLASLGINFTNDRIEGFLNSHFHARDAQLNFDLPRAVLKVWEEALSKMLREERKVEDSSTLGLTRDDQFKIDRKSLLTFWRRKLSKAKSDNDSLKEFFGEKPDYFLDLEKGKVSFIDALPDQQEVEDLFWQRIEDSFTNWAKNEEKFPQDWSNSIHQRLRDELKQSLFHDFSSALKKELKEDERAWKSFEFASSLQTVSMLQSLTSNVDQIKDDTGNIKKDIAELNNALPFMERNVLTRFDALENTVKEFFVSHQNINDLLIDFRKDVSGKLSEIDKDLSETKDYAKQATERISELEVGIGDLKGVGSETNSVVKSIHGILIKPIGDTEADGAHESWAGHSDPVMSLAFFGMGQKLVSLDSKGLAIVWNVADGRQECLKSFRWPGRPDSVAASYHGNSFFTPSPTPGMICEWHIDGRQIRVFAGSDFGSGIRRIALSADGKILGAASENILQLWETETGKHLGAMAPHLRSPLSLGQEKFIEAFCFAPDGQTLVTGGTDGTIKFWDRKTIEDELSVVVWRGDNRKPLINLSGHIGQITDIRFDGSGQFTFSSSLDRTVRVWEISCGSQVASLGFSEPIWGIVVEGDYLIAISCNSQLPEDKTFRSGFISIWNWKENKRLMRYPTHVQGVYSVSISPNGQMLVTGGGDGEIKLWDLAELYRRFL